MPVYEYRCAQCGPFEKRAGYEDASCSCRCGGVANRAPYSGSVGVFVEGRVLPTSPAEQQNYQLNQARAQGWDYDRSMSLIRKNVATDKEGRKHINTAGMVNA